MSDEPVTFSVRKPNYSIKFHNENGVVGKLDFNGPEMKFEGKAEESAKIFFEYIAREFAGRFKT